ncbi:uroporphyrinogen-III synthase [uncultured Aliiroseovarius sp.]|uniref:uroporphyrinogen-III synthase n=1 Tax=uncultured Aliiroseovarius sp. TaxID=1658783 RepID=UPI00262C35DF|nr:uroporphyrinogen-III synthase [uncultured Aliiroseovarius sp.]
MPKLPILVLTRPTAAAQRFLTQVEAALGQEVPHVISPILQIQPVGEWPDLSEVEVILTSEHAVRGDLTGITAHCVGRRTAEAAAAQGAQVQTVAVNAEALLQKLGAQPGNYVHLCGSHKAVDISARLTVAGLSCCDHQVYAQVAQPLTDTARAALEGEDPALLPLFSPRSARLVGEAIAKPARHLQVIGMSDAVAEEWRVVTGETAEIADAPTGDAMVSGIVAALRGHVA